MLRFFACSGILRSRVLHTKSNQSLFFLNKRTIICLHIFCRLNSQVLFSDIFMMAFFVLLTGACGFPIGMNLIFFCETLNSCTIVCLMIFCRFKFLYIEFSSETNFILSDRSFCFL